MVWIELQNIKHAREATASLCQIRCSTVALLSFYLIGRLKLACSLYTDNAYTAIIGASYYHTGGSKYCIINFQVFIICSLPNIRFHTHRNPRRMTSGSPRQKFNNNVHVFAQRFTYSLSYKGHTIGQHYISILYLSLPGNSCNKKTWVSIEIFPIHFSQLIPSILHCCEYQLFDVKFINKNRLSPYSSGPS